MRLLTPYLGLWYRGCCCETGLERAPQESLGCTEEVACVRYFEPEVELSLVRFLPPSIIDWPFQPGQLCEREQRPSPRKRQSSCVVIGWQSKLRGVQRAFECGAS